jgi:hypothetical protein
MVWVSEWGSGRFEAARERAEEMASLRAGSQGRMHLSSER